MPESPVDDNALRNDSPHPEDLAATVHGEASDLEFEQQVAEHLTSCDRCRQLADEFAGWSDFEDRFKKMRDSAPDVPADAIRRVRALLPAELDEASDSQDDFEREAQSGPVTTRVSKPPSDQDLTIVGKVPIDRDMPDFLQQLLSLQETESDDGLSAQYRIDSVIARGGMGIVVQAWDRQLHRNVAMKFLDPKLTGTDEFHERFTREAQAIARVPHPNIIRIYQVGQWRNIPFLVMEYVDGETLSQRIRRFGRMPLGEVLRIGRAITLGLAAVHEQGIVHRDLKPSNILPGLSGHGETIRLSDFGLARAEGKTSLTSPGIVPGTPAYMSPEQAAGKTLDDRSDLYSLGCVLHSMCCGGLPPLKDSDQACRQLKPNPRSIRKSSSISRHGLRS